MFITFEGIDGSGKTTQVNLFAEWLRAKGYTVTVIKEPGSTPIGEKIRDSILKGEDPMEPITQLLLFSAARYQLVHDVIIPKLQAQEIVVCDRYADSTIAYQGYGNGVDLELIHNLNTIAVAGVAPKATFLLDVSPEIALKRRRNEGNLNVYDTMSMDFYNKVRDGYMETSIKNFRRIIKVDASGTIEATAQEIRHIALGRLHL